jgi:hypothetical protein
MNGTARNYGLTVVITMVLAGCVSDPGLYVDTMKGVGSARTLPDGRSVFTFVVPENAYDGIIPRDDKATLRAQHDYILSAWVGSARICPKGYTVATPTRADGMVIYEGACK